MVKTYTSSGSRVWFQSGGAGPSRAPEYQGNWRAGAASWGRGTITIIREPDPEHYNKFIVTGRYRGEPGNPELALTAHYTMQRSELLRIARADCDHTLHVHMGECENPQDFNRGWQKVLILEQASLNSYGTSELGAMVPGDIAPVTEDVPFAGTDLYEVVRMTLSQEETGGIPAGLTGIHVCDSQQCGICGVASDGCQVVFALMGAAVLAGNPTVYFTSDGGATWGNSPVDSAPVNMLADDILCIGSYVVVVSSDDGALHYAPMADVIAGSETWTRTATGVITGGEPVAAFSTGATDTWYVGAAGHIYHSDDVTAGLTISDAGGATTEDLHDVHAFDNLNVVAVGGNNAVVYTNNGGISWTLAPGPATAVVINCVWMHGPLEWSVGTASGRMFSTIDGGVNWVEKSFPGAGVGQVRDIVFSTPSVGYMSHSDVAPHGRLFRTINGGYSWYVMPEGPGAIPVNDYVAKLAVCEDPNVVFGAGLADDGIAGFLIKGA